MKSRNVVEELLDQLAPDDPAAIRSRGDLQRINFMMGNFRWVRRTLRRLNLIDESTAIVEIGAGTGDLARCLQRSCPALSYTAIDLAPEPPDWPAAFRWHQSDVLSCLADSGGEVLVSNLFLHHLSDSQLGHLGNQLSSYKAVVCSEPTRLRRFHGLAYAGRILGFNYVTRHDIHVSIDAGFVHRELPDAMNLSSEQWTIEVDYSPMGAYRMVAIRRETEKLN